MGNEFNFYSRLITLLCAESLMNSKVVYSAPVFIWSICYSNTFIYLSAFIVPSKTCKLPIPYALMHPHTIRDAGFWTERWWHAGRSPSSLAQWTRRSPFPTTMSNLDSSDHRTLFHFETILNDPWPTGHDGASGPCWHMASFSAWYRFS